MRAGTAGGALRYAIDVGRAARVRRGSSAIDRANWLVTYIARAGYHGVDTFAYSASELGINIKSSHCNDHDSPQTPGLLQSTMRYCRDEGIPIAVSLPCAAPVRDRAPGRHTFGTIARKASCDRSDARRFRYAPNADFSGTDGFTYRAADPGGVSTVATATIKVPADGSDDGLGFRSSTRLHKLFPCSWYMTC